MFEDSIIYVAGHTGLLGSALVRKLTEYGYSGVVTKTHAELDLTDRTAVLEFFSNEKPEYVFLAAGKVGGIVSNKTYPADYLHVNMAIQDNVFEAAQEYEVRHLVFYGSSCVYPKFSPQPIREKNLLTGPLEETSEAYATAKIAGIVACKAYNRQYGANRFIALVPNSMYGPNDSFDLASCHVLSALIRRFHEARISNTESVTLWGSGTPRREFIFSEDVAEASIFAMQHAADLENKHYNIGSGKDYSIKELAVIVAKVTGYKGQVVWDTGKPEGAPRKLLDSSRLMSLGWQPTVGIEEGLRKTYEWYQKQEENTLQASGALQGRHAIPTDIGTETQAVILAGGLGQRLKPAVSDKPKVLAEVLDRPFLTYILDQLSSAGIREVVLCTGYMSEKVKEKLGEAYGPLRLLYSAEDKPLGTGGALRLALSYLWSDTVLVMNGDSHTDVDLGAYMDWFLQKDGHAALVLTKVPDTGRYGRVVVDENERITNFDEKGASSGCGWINAGIYLLKKSLIASIPVGRPYSLEREFFPSLIEKKLLGYRAKGRFIDIGTPASYAAAKEFFAVNSTSNFARKNGGLRERESTQICR